jgi:hypothetical protein
MTKSNVVAYQEPVEDTKGGCLAIADATKPKVLWRRRLKSATDVRRWLANLLLDLRADRVSCEKAKAEAYIASLILRCVESSDLERRLEDLEEGLTGRRR